LGADPKAAAGVDGITWQEYGLDLEANLRDLHARVHRGAYRAKPTRRAYIPKPDGRLRPLGIAALEDKILQRAVVEVLNAIYEEDFVGFSYGFRPGRSQHQALDALAVGILRKRVNYVLDADIRGYFDSIDRSWMIRFLEHRIADERVVRLIRKWLVAGVMEDGEWSDTTEGTVQGAGSGASRRCRACARWSARPCPPNPACGFHRTGLSTGHAVADRDVGVRQRRPPAGWWSGLFREPSPTAMGSGDRDSDIG